MQYARNGQIQNAQPSHTVTNDLASLGSEHVPTATAPSHAIPTTLPTELAGKTPNQVDRITLINVMITA
jgi:hypothetical protein